MRPISWQNPTVWIFRSVKKFLGELTKSTIATLIVTAAFSNLLFVTPNRPEHGPQQRPTGDLVFSPLPAAPAVNFSLDSSLPEPAGKMPLKEKPTREQAAAHKSLRSTAKPVDVAAIQTPAEAPLQLIGASMTTPPVADKPAASTAASGTIQSAAAILRPLQAIAGHISWLLPKL
jgi:hypothetical protein